MNSHITPADSPTTAPIASHPVTCADAYASVFYGAITPGQAANAVWSGVPADRKAMITASVNALDSHPLYAWSGSIPGAVGKYWVANPYRSQAVFDRGRQSGKGIGYVTRARTLGAADLGLFAVVKAEIDDRPIAEQVTEIDRFERVTGLRFAVLALSGDVRPESRIAAKVAVVAAGKSIHSFVALDPTDHETLTTIGKLLVVWFRSDPATYGPAQPMRLPGVLGRLPEGTLNDPVRIQTCLRADPVHYVAQDVIQRLVVALAGEGVTDPMGAFTALQRAQEASKLAGSEKARLTDVERAELRGIAARTKAARAVSTEDDVRFDTLRAKAHPHVAGHAVESGKDVVLLPSNAKITLRDGRVVPLDWAACPDGGVVCYDPLHETPGTSSPSAKMVRTGRVHSFAGGLSVTYVVDTSGPLTGVEILTGKVDPPSVPTVQAPTYADEGVDLDSLFQDPTPEVQAQWAVKAARLAPFDIEPEAIPSGSPRAGEYKERLRRREARAADLTPTEVTLARAAETHARKVLLPRVQAAYGSKLGVAPHYICGWFQGCYDTGSGSMATVRRRCGNVGCGYCGPLRVSLAIAGLFRGPMTWTEKGARFTALGTFGEGHLAAYHLPESDWASFSRKVRRAGETVRTSSETEKKGLEDVRTVSGGVLVALHLEDGTVWAFTSPLPPSKRGPKSKFVPVREFLAVDAAETFALDLVLGSLRWTPMDITGLEAIEWVVDPKTWLEVSHCRVTSSDALIQDPQALVSLARAHGWVAEINGLAPRALADGLKAEGLSPRVDGWNPKDPESVALTTTETPQTWEGRRRLWGYGETAHTRILRRPNTSSESRAVAGLTGAQETAMMAVLDEPTTGRNGETP